jgi:hypothetical protein
MSLLASAAAQKTSPALTAADGATIPYRVRFDGKDLDLTSGEAPLPTHDRARERLGGALEVVAPQAAHVTRDYSDHLIVVVTAK